MKNSIVLTVFALLFLSSCSIISHNYHIPNVQNVPLLKEKGDINIVAAIGTDDLGSSIKDMQLGYALTNKIGLIGNFMSATDNEGVELGNLAYINQLELGAGYLGISKTNNWQVDIYSGLGIEQQKHRYAINYLFFNEVLEYGKSQHTTINIFLQPSIAYTHKIVDIALSTRIKGISAYKINYEVTEENTLFTNKIDWLKNNRNNIAFEPALTLRLGYKAIKFHAQYLLSFNTMNREYSAASYSHLSLGLSFAISKRNKLFSKN